MQVQDPSLNGLNKPTPEHSSLDILSKQSPEPSPYSPSGSTQDLGILSTYRQILRRQWKVAIAVFFAVTTVTAIAAFSQKPIYDAEGKLLFRREATTPLFTGLGREVSDFKALRDQSSPVDTEVEILRSHPIITKTINNLNLRDDKGKPITLKKFLLQFNSTNTKGTDIIQINFKDNNPEVAAAVVNMVMKVYLEEQAENYRQISANARKFIEKEVPLAEKKVQQSELALREFRQANNVVSLDEEQKSSVQFLFNLKNELKTARSQLSDTESQFRTVQSRLGVDTARAVYVTTVSQSKGVQDLVAEKQRLEVQLASERTRYLDDSVVIQGLQDRLSKFDTLLQQRIELVSSQNIEGLVENNSTNSLQKELTTQLVQLEVRREGLAGQIRNLLNLEAQYKQRIDSLPKLEQQQRELNRRLDAAQTPYVLLLKKMEELRVAENQGSENARIVAAAMVPKEASSNKSLVLAAGTFLGGLLAIGAATLADSMGINKKPSRSMTRLTDNNIYAANQNYQNPNISGDLDSIEIQESNEFSEEYIEPPKELFDEVVSELEGHRDVLQVKQLIFYACINIWENDRNKLERVNLKGLIQELIELTSDSKQLKSLMAELIQNIDPKYAEIADVTVSEIEKLYPDYNQQSENIRLVGK